MSHIAPPQTPTQPGILDPEDQPRILDAEDWDGTTHVLVGIRLDITPADARRADIMGCLEKLSEHKTKHELEVITKRLDNHQKMTQLFAPRVRNGHNTLLYLLCSCYQPGERSPLGQRNTKVRKPITQPLEFWDLLYYAIVAEIRLMYAALKDAHGENFEHPKGKTMLHEAGPDATSDTKLPVSALGLAVLLESMWAVVTDPRHLSTLDLAVRTRNLREGKGEDSHGEDNDDLIGHLDDSGDNIWKTDAKAPKHVHDATCDALATAEGLIDTNAMTPDEIHTMVWSMYAERNKKLQTGMPREDENRLAKFRAELREEIALNRTKSSNTSAYCSCDPSCYCHDVCDLVVNECSCAHSRGEVREMVEKQVKEQKDIFTKSGSSSALFPNHMLGAVSNDVAQMHVAAMAVPDPIRAQACFSNKEASDALDGLILDQHRKRSNTADSSLAYVPAYVPPPRTPSRHKKDAYPLGLYGGEGSGQRYPTFKSQIADPTPPPVYDYNSQIPVRKPVPRNFSKPVTSSSPWQSSPSPNTHSGLPASESQSRIARSFPDTAHGNTRMPFLHDGDDDEDDSTAYTYLTQETEDSIRPFSDEPEMYNPQITTSNSTTQLLPAPRRPTITTSATSPAGPLSLPRSRTKILFSFGRSASPPAIDPNEPLPDFIAPKPAKVQRYVSAGGTAKLHEREEIAGPAFTPATDPSMPVMQKDEWMEKMKDPEFVRSYFGEEALSKMDSVDETRASMETPLGGKRERGDTGASGSSGRFSAKLKRVFSRKSSGCE
ncbi:hypothetical protein LTR17_001528 [Elasticomyces elasticus]|nr:hypothetical protein LTR17_001528 [Elasticomyces elasticus]